MSQSKSSVARICAGVPEKNNTLYWRVGFVVGDPVALIEISQADRVHTELILRDIEVERARQSARADSVSSPAEFTPLGGLSGDRETATAQAAAEYLRRQDISEVVADRTLPLIFAEYLSRAGIAVECDPEMWVTARRQKTEQEIEHLRAAQHTTERAVQFACEMIARANPDKEGLLTLDNQPLTSERVRTAVDHFLMDEGFVNPTSIVAGGPQGADCHNIGAGTLRTAEPVIVDIFPRCRSTRYWGDCTRTVVHGEIPDRVRKMHQAVCRAKAISEQATAVGVTGEQVHQATIDEIRNQGFSVGLPDDESPNSYCAMTHGTGHGVGLDIHEPPLLDIKGPPLLAGEAMTIEPGLYCREIGGIRVEDMVIVRDNGCENLNSIQEGLTWT